MYEVCDAVHFIHMMHICYSPVNLNYAVSVCSVFLMRELSINLTSSHGSLNVQFSHKPLCMLQPYTATCHWSGIVFCTVFSIVSFCVV